MQHPLAVQLYTIRERPLEGRPEALRAIAGAGYRAVEPFGDPAGFPRLREELDAVGLSVCSVHSSPARDGFETVVAGARALGTDTVIVPSVDRARWNDADGVRGLAQELNALAARGAAEGLRIGYHNHWFEFASIDGRTALEVLAEQLDPGVLLELDTYWAALGGVDVVQLLGTLGDRVRFVHVKDGPVSDPEAPMTAVGSGSMPTLEILGAATSVEWYVVELDACATDPLVAVLESAAWLRGQNLVGSGDA